MAESQWGRLNAGQVYGILATDVDRALACANLRDYEAILIQHIREHSWGTSARRKRRGEPWPDARPFRPDLQALAADLEVPFQRLYEARSRLLKARLLLEAPDGLTINKAAHQWLCLDAKGNPVGPRLDGPRLAYCAAARDRRPNNPNPPEFQAETPKEIGDDSRGSVNAIHTSTLRAFTPKCEDGSRGSVNVVHADALIGSRGSVNDAHKNRAREDPTGLEIQKTQTDAGGGGWEDGLHKPGDVLRHPEADLDALAEKLDALAPGSYWGAKVRQFATMYPLHWIEEAAQIGAAKGKGWEFVAGILRRYQRDGGPDRGPSRATGTAGHRRGGPDIDGIMRGIFDGK